MMKSSAIIGLPQWLESPVGKVLLAWEQRHLDEVVADVFGFHALQLGLPELDGLRANRMPHRWVAVEEPAATSVHETGSVELAPADENIDLASPSAVESPRRGIALRCHFDQLPFDSASLDLVVLPHTLELSRDPHQTLSEVERVLMPEGRVVIVGFNPASLWGLRQKFDRVRQRSVPGPSRDLFLPSEGDFIGYRRLRDWLRLLSFEVEAGRFGCYVPPVRSAAWLARFGWMETVGERWWPVFGSLYFVGAVKRVRGMRLVGLVREQRLKPVAAPAPVAAAHRHEQRSRSDAA